MHTLKLARASTLMLSSAFLGACGETEAPDQAHAEPTGPSWVLASAPADAKAVTEVKSEAKEGDTVVIRGRIGGRKVPISADSPVFTIIDLALPYCGQLHPENCPTPWDYCCETPATLTANGATIQITGDGDVSPDAGGLKPLDEVIIVGTVGARPSDDVLTIRATGIHRVEG